MPFQGLKIRPGVYNDYTPLLAEASFTSCQLVRFFEGMLQKIGGWLKLSQQKITGTARALVSFQDENSVVYIGIGSESSLSVWVNRSIIDITPIQATSDLSTPFSTTMGSNVITVTDAAGVAEEENIIQIINYAAIDGLILQGTYVIQSVIDATHYTINAASNATSTVASGGAAALFTTLNTSNVVQVTLNNHGLSAMFNFTVGISTTVGGITLFGIYSVNTVIDANNFTIIAAGSATSSTTGSENGGDIRILYEIEVGNAQPINSQAYGTGEYGVGFYGVGSATGSIPARLWSLGAWGTDMVASYTNGSVYAWITENGLINNQATIISQAPHNINAGIFVAMPEQQIVALGASDRTSDATDQLLIRWCDIADYTDWVASATNQAGSFRIPRGSRIVGGIQGPQQGLIWTDLGIWAMQYIGFPLVYGFNELAEGCGLIGQNARGVLGGKVYWMSSSSFFVYDGNSVQPLPCSVWDKIFQNFTGALAQTIIAAPNSNFNEISFFYPATDNSSGVAYVKYNASSNVWDYGVLTRTAWMDQSTIGAPVGVDGNNLLQLHEASNDADGSIINSWAQTGWFKIAEGEDYAFIERIIPDFIYYPSTNTTATKANILLTLQFQDYPNAPILTIGPLTATQATRYLIVRGRGRLVNIKIESNDKDTWWRLGEILYKADPAGRR